MRYIWGDCTIRLWSIPDYVTTSVNLRTLVYVDCTVTIYCWSILAAISTMIIACYQNSYTACRCYSAIFLLGHDMQILASEPALREKYPIISCLVVAEEVIPAVGDFPWCGWNMYSYETTEPFIRWGPRSLTRRMGQFGGTSPDPLQSI